jgi:long-chain fatty acid transport protein
MNRWTQTCVVALAATAVSSAHAGGFALSEQDARATGRSGTAIAADASPSAIHYNPAGLMGLNGPAATLGMTAILPRVSATDPASGEISRNVPGVKTPPHVFAAWGNDSLGIGLGFNAPFGGGMQWADDWRGRYDLVELGLQVFGLHLAGAYALSPEWSVGATVTGYQASVSLKRRQDFVSNDGLAFLAGSGFGAAGTVGLSWAPSDGTYLKRLGLVARLPASVSLQGRAHFEDVPDAFTGMVTDQGIRSGLTLPAKVGLGSQFQLGQMAFFAEAEVTFWSSFRSFDVDFENTQTPDVKQPRNWTAAGTFRVGAERDLWGFTARAGALFDMAASPANTLSPSLPDSHRLGATLGLGKGLGKVRADLAYMLVAFLPRTSTGEAFPARYSALAHLFALTVAYGI